MHTVVVYESMFGNTRAIAEAIVQGIGQGDLLRVADAGAAPLDGADLVVVGGPTHVRGMSRPSTRKGAPSYVGKPGRDLTLEPGADSGPGVREWLSSLGTVHKRSAAFDTRMKGPAFLTGRASKGIAQALSRHGLTAVVRPESFLVTKDGHLVPGEFERARAWGAKLALVVGSSGAANTTR
jgi:hypothetical protein